MPELVDDWLKVSFGLFLKYKQIFRLPKMSQRLVEMSKALKRLRALLADPAQCALCGVAILTDMAFEETKDLLAACQRMQVNAPLLFLNLATPPSDCSLCWALWRRESVIEQKFRRAFPAAAQIVVYRHGEPRGLARLGQLGQSLYAAPATKDVDLCVNSAPGGPGTFPCAKPWRASWPGSRGGCPPPGMQVERL
jgi:arsenite-transporting ATPase